MRDRVRKERQKILKEIDRLEDIYCSACTVEMPEQSNRYCLSECQVGAKFKKLGEELNELSTINVKKTLAKGSNMTNRDVVYLIGREITRKEILKAMGLTMSVNNQKMLNSIINNASKGDGIKCTGR